MQWEPGALGGEENDQVRGYNWVAELRTFAYDVYVVDTVMYLEGGVSDGTTRAFNEQERADMLNAVKINVEVAKNVTLVVAAMSATVGSVVSIFLAFASEQMKSSSTGVASKAELFRHEWYRSRIRMLGINAIISIVSLLGNSIFCVAGVAFGYLGASLALYGIGFFSFGIYCILLPLLLYVVQEFRYSSLASGGG